MGDIIETLFMQNCVCVCVQSMSMGVSQGSLSLAKSQEAVTKLPEPCFKVLANYNISNADPMPNSYIR